MRHSKETATLALALALAALTGCEDTTGNGAGEQNTPPGTTAPADPDLNRPMPGDTMPPANPDPATNTPPATDPAAPGDVPPTNPG